MTVVRAGLARAVVLLTIGLVAAGCTVLTGGKAQIPPRFMPRSVTGSTIRQVLLGDSTLSRILHQPFTIDPRLPPRFGGPETLQDFGSDLPTGCLGVAEMLHQSVYESSKVNDVAVEAWRHAARSAELTSVKEGVVSLPTSADATALFSKFSQQWQRCDGQELLLPDPVLRLKARISNVQVAHLFSRELSRSRSLRPARTRNRFQQGVPLGCGTTALSRSRLTTSTHRRRRSKSQALSKPLRFASRRS